MDKEGILYIQWNTATAKSLQSCLTLYDPIDSSPPGSPIPGILQARTLEWVAFPSPMEYWYNGILLQWNATTMEYYSAIKKNEIMPFAATWMDLKMIILSEVSQITTNIWYHICIESKRWYKWPYLQNRNRLIAIENKLMVTKGNSEGEGKRDKLQVWD